MTTETSERCNRCGAALGAEPSIIGIQAGRLQAGNPVLNLCPKCTDSFEHWLARRRSGRSEGRSKSSNGASSPAKSGSASSRSSKEDGAHHDRSRDDQFRLLLVLAAVAIIGLLLALVLVLLLRH